MKFIELIKAIGVVKKTVVKNGNTYEIPYNQSEKDYENAGNFNNPSSPFSFLTSTKFTGKYKGPDPIFEVTYKLPLNAATDVGWNGWIILETKDEEHIGESFTNFFTKDSIKIEEDGIVYKFKAIPSCTLKNVDDDDEEDEDEYGYDAYEEEVKKCITEILNPKSLKEYYKIDVSEEDCKELRNSNERHICAPIILYNAVIGNISENDLEELNSFLEGTSEYSMEREHLMNVESLDQIKEDFLEMFESDYLTVDGERFIFVCIHED